MTGARSYSYRASGATLDALSNLQSPWTGFAWNDARFLAGLKGNHFVEIRREERVLEPKFSCSRIVAVESTVIEGSLENLAFTDGSNRVFTIEAEEWIEIAPGQESTSVGRSPEVRAAGTPGAGCASALARCLVTCGVMVQGARGRRIVISCGWPVLRLVVVTNEKEIDDIVARFRVVEVSPDSAA